MIVVVALVLAFIIPVPIPVRVRTKTPLKRSTPTDRLDSLVQYPEPIDVLLVKLGTVGIGRAGELGERGDGVGGEVGEEVVHPGTKVGGRGRGVGGSIGLGKKVGLDVGQDYHRGLRTDHTTVEDHGAMSKDSLGSSVLERWGPSLDTLMTCLFPQAARECLSHVTCLDLHLLLSLSLSLPVTSLHFSVLVLRVFLPLDHLNSSQQRSTRNNNVGNDDVLIHTVVHPHTHAHTHAHTRI